MFRRFLFDESGEEFDENMPLIATIALVIIAFIRLLAAK